MANEKETVSADNATEALNTIKEMKRAGLKRSIIPRWFAASIAILIFALFASIQEEGPNGLVYVGLSFILYRSIQRKLGVITNFSYKTVGFIFLLTSSYLFTVFLLRIHELILAPYIGGTIAAFIYYSLYELKRIRTNAKQAKGQSL